MQIKEYHPFPWYWEAIYENGETLREVADDGTLRYFKDIDLSRAVAFVLRPKEPTHPQFGVHLGDGRRLIFFRRRSRVLDMTTNEQYDGHTWHVIGFQQTINGSNAKFFQFIAEDGVSFLSNDDSAV